ncbi:hypothetical protein BST86_13720 [Nonlabens agnitus]|uniref:TonB C-terminal domain-containing protein n=1 Tax=Nonlabens agnitus TaxID=870484 RepID=A0A2S9WX71_9FLAO|nr:hypothetical protein BST86_13720 [Nonlabens agnitus]
MLLSVTACKSELDKDREAAQIASKRFQELDTTTVDVYPQFKDCDELLSSSDCFYKNLHQLIKSRLSSDTLSMEIKAKDSLVAQFTVNKIGRISYDSISRCANHLDKKYLDSIMQQKFQDLPTIDSALKQGTPVSSSYLVPIVVQPVGTTLDQ